MLYSVMHAQAWHLSKSLTELSYQVVPDPEWSVTVIIYNGSTLLEGCKVLLINGLGFPHLPAAASPFTKDHHTTDSKWESWTLSKAKAVE